MTFRTSGTTGWIDIGDGLAFNYCLSSSECSSSNLPTTDLDQGTAIGWRMQPLRVPTSTVRVTSISNAFNCELGLAAKIPVGDASNMGGDVVIHFHG